MASETDNETLLRAAARDMGVSVNDMLSNAVARDPGCPGICRQCSTVADDVEPDARCNYCEVCDAQTVVSVLVLAELV